MTEHQETLLNLLEAVDKFCRQQNISYVMLGGTMLGAYRHQGFIPWDDDMDIGMPRADYERFLRAAVSLPEPLILRHFSLEQNVPYAFAHVENKETTYMEARRSGNGYVGGVCLEIFPLDAVPGGNCRQWYRERQVKLWKKLLYASIMERGREGKNPVRRMGIRLLRRSLTVDQCVQRLNAMLLKDTKKDEKRKKRSGQYGNLLGHWERRENIPASVMFPAKEYTFEGKRFLGVNCPKEYLTSLYGADFMTPPPVCEQEKGKHEAAYCNLHLPYREYKK